MGLTGRPPGIMAGPLCLLYPWMSCVQPVDMDTGVQIRSSSCCNCFERAAGLSSINGQLRRVAGRINLAPALPLDI